MELVEGAFVLGALLGAVSVSLIWFLFRRF
jgi:hypothetical protein